MQFQSFVDKAGNYVLSTFKDDGDAMPLFMKLEDPKSSFNANYRPVALTEEKRKIKSQWTFTKRKLSCSYPGTET